MMTLHPSIESDQPAKSWRALLQLGLLVAFAFAGAGCGSSVVGFNCSEESTQCDDRCVDLTSDPNACGACDVVCLANEVCVSSVCRAEGDAGLADTDPGDTDPGDVSTDAMDASPDVEPDAGPDASDSGPDADDAEPGDATPDGDTSPPPISCGRRLTDCAGECVDVATSRAHCGGCGIVCTGAQLCVEGLCQASCVPPNTLCGDLCQSVLSSPNACGMCGDTCSDEGYCRQGRCILDAPGHLVVVGHDLSNSRPAMDRIVANSVLLAEPEEPRVVIFEGSAVPSALTGLRSAINAQATLVERSVTFETATKEQIAWKVEGADVLIIASQAGSDSAEIDDLAARLEDTLQTFVERGGVLVVLDGGGGSGGTYRVLPSTLFQASGQSDVSLDTVMVIAAADPIAAGVPRTYVAERNSVRFDYMGGGNVVQLGTRPVVVHRVFE